MKKKWYRCKYMISPLGVAFCTKTATEEYDATEFCKRSECEEIEVDD